MSSLKNLQLLSNGEASPGSAGLPRSLHEVLPTANAYSSTPTSTEAGGLGLAPYRDPATKWAALFITTPGTCHVHDWSVTASGASDLRRTGGG